MNTTNQLLKMTIFVLSVTLVSQGCTSVSEKDVRSIPDVQLEEIEIKEFILSPGDSISISVYKHEDLNREITVPPDGIIFFPIAGEIQVKGKSIRDLREIIARDLSEYRVQSLLPGDEVSVSVFLHGEYDRKFIVPSDGYLFVPNVGEIQTNSKSLREIRQIITEGLSEYVVDPQVMIDIVKSNNLARIVDPQVSVEVTNFIGQRMFILGEVNRPGIYVIETRMSLIEAIAMAGGFTRDADQDSVLLVRSREEEQTPHLVLISLKKYLQGGDDINNPAVRKGDIIFVSRSFIADVELFFGYFSRIISPLLDLETGYWIGQNIVVGPAGRTGASP